MGSNISSSEIIKIIFYTLENKERKGIFSLMKILEGQKDINLTIVGREKYQEIETKSQNIKVIEIVNDKKINSAL